MNVKNENYKDLMRTLLHMSVCEAKLGNIKAMLYIKTKRFKDLCKQFDLTFDNNPGSNDDAVENR